MVQASCQVGMDRRRKVWALAYSVLQAFCHFKARGASVGCCPSGLDSSGSKSLIWLHSLRMVGTCRLRSGTQEAAEHLKMFTLVLEVGV